MLTADLVRARRKDDELHVSELKPKQRPRALELTADFIALAEAHVGQTRAELEEAFASVELAPSEQKLAQGLRKLVEDRLLFESESAIDPRGLRSELFARAASERRALGVGEQLDRNAFLASEAVRLSTTPAAVERALYADLRNAQVVRGFEPITAEQLVAHYDLAQKQAVLLKAVSVTAEVRCRDAYAYRVLFRKLKFFRLLHRIEPRERGGYRIVIDGPFSLFSAGSKYGLELALALPSLLACDEYEITAALRWGKERLPLRFRIEGRGRAATEAAPRLPDEVEALCTRFAALASAWRVEPASDILDLPGIGLCVPDLRFVHAETGEVAYLEVLGYWSRDAVWKRVELCERGLLSRVIFAVSTRLRVSEEVLPESTPSELYVYKGSLSAREVLRRLDGSREAPLLLAK